ncbi:MAG: hypothetical protein ACLP59_05575 [Bryobacteraceae bacterium]
MSTLSAILIIIVIILLAAVVWLTIAWRRSQRLRSKFGPEYPRAVSEFGDRQRAERELERREKRVQNLEIRPLAPATRDRFVKAWHDDQERFVDDPKGALMEAERLVQAVMRERGYPVADFDQRVGDISVDHPELVQNYRAAREVVLRQQHGQASTEDMRRALVHYRTLFDELLEVQEVR